MALNAILKFENAVINRFSCKIALSTPNNWLCCQGWGNGTLLVKVLKVHEDTKIEERKG